MDRPQSPFHDAQEDPAIRAGPADVDKIATSCMLWADQMFPTRTDVSMFLKMYGELAELIDAGAACDDEIADILILVLDYAKRKQINIADSIHRKLAINRGRVWELTPIGTMQHVEDTRSPRISS